jgi:hypothetical protein
VYDDGLSDLFVVRGSNRGVYNEIQAFINLDSGKVCTPGMALVCVMCVCYSTKVNGLPLECARAT